MVEKQSGLPVYIESVNSSNLRSVMDASRSEAKLAGVMGHAVDDRSDLITSKFSRVIA